MKGALIKQKYKIIKILSQNSLTETFLAQSTGLQSHKRYVIKKFRLILGNPQAKAVKDLLHQEADALKLLGGQNSQIPQLEDYFVDGEDFYLVREWIEGVTLEQKVQQQGKLSEAEVTKILSSILAVLQYIHDRGIIYRELSPSSIVLRQQNGLNQAKEDCVPVLIYFSGAKELKRETQRLNQHSLVLANQQGYVSPEQEQGESAYASDLYSLGLTAIYLLTGKTPAELDIDPYTNRLLWHPENSDITSNLVRVIDRAICPNVSDRYTSTQQMLNALSPQSVTISESLITQPEEKSKLTPEVKIVTALSFLSLATIAIAFAILNLDFDIWQVESNIRSAMEDEKTVPLPQSPAEFSEEEISPQAVFNIPVFRVGTPQQQLISSLGQPTLESQGYWGQSRAFLYKDFGSKQVDLGYLWDLETQNILQTEISFPESVPEVEVQQVLKQLLMADYSREIEQKITQVINQKSDKQEFSVNNLEGIVQRNLQNRVYVGVWKAGFHQ